MLGALGNLDFLEPLENDKSLKAFTAALLSLHIQRAKRAGGNTPWDFSRDSLGGIPRQGRSS